MSYYRTTYTIRVLSEEPVPNELEITDVLREADSGDYVAHVTTERFEQLSAASMSEALIEAGSDPSFFGIEDAVA